jgi:hypothetical protein
MPRQRASGPEDTAIVAAEFPSGFWLSRRSYLRHPIRAAMVVTLWIARAARQVRATPCIIQELKFSTAMTMR